MKLDNVFKKTRLSSARKSYIALNHRGPEVPEGLLGNVTNAVAPSLPRT